MGQFIWPLHVHACKCIFYDVSFPSQWMTAGRGIVHSEMPASDGDNIGLQLWINLKRADKVSVTFILEM